MHTSNPNTYDWVIYAFELGYTFDTSVYVIYLLHRTGCNTFSHAKFYILHQLTGYTVYPVIVLISSHRRALRTHIVYANNNIQLSLAQANIQLSHLPITCSSVSNVPYVRDLRNTLHEAYKMNSSCLTPIFTRYFGAEI